MAHGRKGPDIVQTTRYVGSSEIRAVTEHEKYRSPDGSSAIDPLRSHLNEILHGPKTQQEAVDGFWAQGVKRPTKQAENPYIQMVLSASPEFFRQEGQGPGEWNAEKLEAWKQATMDWLRKEYAADLAHVSLHLDEDTPHFHALIIPTYERKTRKPSRRVKSGETEDEFHHRLEAWKADPGGTRTVGRSSNTYWKKAWARRIARQSYHAAVSPLGLGYGKDFVGEDEPSPKRKETGTWVREQATKVQEEKLALEASKAQLDDERRKLEEAAKEEARLAELERLDMRKQLDDKAAALDEKADKLKKREKRVSEDKKFISRLMQRLMKVITVFKDSLGLPMTETMEDAISALEAEVEHRLESYDNALEAPTEDSAEDFGPGF